jgi:hypothetical protein
VIGGYTIGDRSFDARIFGYYDGDQLAYHRTQLKA